jgi:gas vesicle protein
MDNVNRDVNRDPINRDTAKQEEIPRVAIYEDEVETRANEPHEATTSSSDTKTDLTAKHSPDEIEHSIEQTQERIAESIDELAKRLNPSHIKDQAVQSLNDSLNLGGLQHLFKDVKGSLSEGAKTSGMKLLEGVKHNPTSSALIGLGVGAMAIGGIIAARTDSSSYPSYYKPKSYNKPKAVKTKTHTYDERLRGMMETIENKPNDYESDNTSKLGEKFQEAKSVVNENVHHAKEVAAQGAQRAKEGVSHFLEAQPLAVGAIALLAGAAVGLLLPKTSYENKMMGEKSDELISRAKGKANEVVDVAKSTVSDVLQTAKETVGEVVQTAKDTAKETAKAATS